MAALLPVYSTIDEVWGSEPITIEDLEQLNETDYFRTVDAASSIQERRAITTNQNTKGIPAYLKTLENIRDNGDPASNATIPSLSSATRNAVFPTDIFGNIPGQLAHLIPHGKTAVPSYWFVIPFLFNIPAEHGLGNNHWTQNQCSRLLNGTLNPRGNGRNRFPGTGLKHLNLNKISLHGQAEHYDRDPHIIIVPIMTIEEMRDYDGIRGYDAIVVTGFNSGFMDTDEGNLRRYNRMIANHTNLSMYEGPQASQDELVTATNLLRNMLSAILKVKHNRMNDDIEETHQYERQNTTLPVLLDTNGGFENLRVAKVEFGGPSQARRHPAPDPVLVAVKAAVNWSRRHNLALAAQAEPPEEDDEEWGELDQLAAEQYMEWCESLIKPPDNFHDLAAGLGQRDAICPDDWGIDTTTTPNRGYQSLMPNVRALLDLE